MSYVVAAPEMMTAAAADLATMGSTLDAAHMAAAASTVAVVPAAADEVSVGITHLFSQHAQDYQALAVKAAAFQQQFVHRLTASAGSFASAEAANGALLRPLAASASSIGDSIGAFWDQLVNMFNDALTGLGNFFTGVWNAVVSFLNQVLTDIEHFILGVVFILFLAILFPQNITL